MSMMSNPLRGESDHHVAIADNDVATTVCQLETSPLLIECAASLCQFETSPSLWTLQAGAKGLWT
jgi:hypothetical protein